MPDFPAASAVRSFLVPTIAAVVAAAIFLVDTATTLDVAVAVLYVAVVLLAMDFAGRIGILFVAAGCGALTVVSFIIVHAGDPVSGAALRCVISLTAIAVTGVLAARHLGTVEAVREQASLLDLTHDTIFVRNGEDVITYWNRAATELYGWQPEQAVGRKAAELLQTAFPAPVDAIMAELSRTGRWEGELVHTTRDGGRVTVASRWATRRGARGHDQGRASVVLETNNDITRWRVAEDGLHRARSELAHVGRIATMGELTASIAHEVNQPLAAVVTNGEACLRWLARAVPNIEQARASVEHMIRNGQRASDVVRRLRALSRKDDPAYAPLAVADVVNDVALLIGRELQANRVQLTIEASPDMPMVQGDRVQLQQVVMNLLMNGIQAMAGATDRQHRLSVRMVRENDGVALVVCDRGPGIAPENLERLFDAFFTTRKDGMGMGLSISRSIVEAHGGRIWATNREEGGGQEAGACFHVFLPSVKEGMA
jgi:PAS domain S-box-containing protein